MALPPWCCVKNLDLCVMAVALETIGTIKVSHHRRELISTSECPTFDVSLQSPNGPFSGIDGDVADIEVLLLQV